MLWKNYLSFQFVPTNETFFKGVFCLQPGHYFIYEDGKMEISRYFEPNFTGKYGKKHSMKLRLKWKKS